MSKHKITGRICSDVRIIEGVPKVHFWWKGGDICGISYALVDAADERYIRRVDDDHFTLGPFKLRILGKDEKEGVYICQRVADN